jgi:hypothetical protein
MSELTKRNPAVNGGSVKLIRLSDIQERAKLKGDDYARECIQSGELWGDYLLLDEDVFEAIRKKYRGVGDLVHDILAPAVERIDNALGTNLKNCGGCKARREWLNKLFG